MTVEETMFTMALTRLYGIGAAPILELYRKVGNAKSIFEAKDDLKALVPDVSERMASAVRMSGEAIEKAQIELDFAVKHNITCISYNDERYPQRLRECPDAPLMLYSKGNTDMNRRKIISIVGTRQNTQYGKDLVMRFMSSLREYLSDVLVVSGLAYGTDICAHRAAMKYGYQTVGVLAHGLDTLYPASHRRDAEEMITSGGGLVTEYMSETSADKPNFLARNRIIAGMSDATIIVESAFHGGSLVTASLAQGYNRDVFAFPGAVNAEFSQGCNNLIRDNGAALITSAEDFIHAMKWDDEKVREEKKSHGIERAFFQEFTPDEEAIVGILQKENDMQINILSVKSNIPINRLTATLFELEMKGTVKQLPGGVYHLFI